MVKEQTTDFPELQEKSELADLHDSYSDLYKDIYGMRPRFHSEDEWNSVEKMCEIYQNFMDVHYKLTIDKTGRKIYTLKESYKNAEY